MKLLLDLRCEVLVELRSLKRGFEVIDCWETVREVLEEAEHFRGPEAHELTKEIGLKFRPPFSFLPRQVAQPVDKYGIEVALKLGEIRLVKYVLDALELDVHLGEKHVRKRFFDVLSPS